MILIVSFENNEHVAQVTQHLTRPFAVVDVAWFPTSLGLRARAGKAHDQLGFTLPAGHTINLDEVGAVWYRRIRPMEVDPQLQDSAAKMFAWSESNEALLGTWYSMNCFWMNPPTSDEVALRKVYQLRVAREVGLEIPETLVTNEPDAAREFIQTYGVGKVIRKAFRNIAEAPRETEIITARHMAILDSVRYAPVIFQEFVPAELDLRVTVIDGEIYAASVKSDTSHRVDYRGGLQTATVKSHQLPTIVEDQLRDYMQRLNVFYGAIDFRLTPDGRYVFLEINPAGEYLFISGRTGQPIPNAIAATLERHDKAHTVQHG